MFGNIGQLAGLLRNAGQIQESIRQAHDRLAAARFVGEAGAGQVRATVDGRGELVSVKLETALVVGGDVELTEELIVAAVRDAVVRSREAAAREIETATGGLNLESIMKMLGR